VVQDKGNPTRDIRVAYVVKDKIVSPEKVYQIPDEMGWRCMHSLAGWIDRMTAEDPTVDIIITRRSPLDGVDLIHETPKGL
jgi:hypothetical protein